MVNTAGTIGRAEPLRHDAFATKRARMAEDDRTVAGEML
jgi:hypothetical protein